jgi:hypothetical protein
VYEFFNHGQGLCAFFLWLPSVFEFESYLWQTGLSNLYNKSDRPSLITLDSVDSVYCVVQSLMQLL